MSDTHSEQAPTERRRPKPLTRETSTGMAAMLRRVVPAGDVDSGLSRLDVAAFNSSI